MGKGTKDTVSGYRAVVMIIGPDGRQIEPGQTLPDWDPELIASLVESGGAEEI